VPISRQNPFLTCKAVARYTFALARLSCLLIVGNARHVMHWRSHLAVLISKSVLICRLLYSNILVSLQTDAHSFTIQIKKSKSFLY